MLEDGAAAAAGQNKGLKGVIAGQRKKKFNNFLNKHF